MSALGEEEAQLLAQLSTLCEVLSEIPYETLLEMERRVGLDNSNIAVTLDQSLRAGAFVTYCAEHGLYGKMIDVVGELLPEES